MYTIDPASGARSFVSTRWRRTS